MKTSPTMNPQWESGNDFPGAILDKSADLKYFIKAITEEPCKTWMGTRPHTTPTKDARARRSKKTIKKCGCSPKSAPAALPAPLAKKTRPITAHPTRHGPRRITFLEEKAADIAKRWHAKVREQNLVFVSTPKIPYRTPLGCGKHRAGSPLTPSRNLREGFWGPSRIRPTNIVPEVPKIPPKYCSSPEKRASTATTTTLTRRETGVDSEARPVTAPSTSVNDPIAQVSFRRFKSFYPATSHTPVFGYTSVTRFPEQRGTLDPEADARRSRFGTLVRSISSAHQSCSAERILRERSTRSLNRIRNFLRNRGDKSETALSEISQTSFTEDPDHFDSLYVADSKTMPRESVAIDMLQDSDESLGIPKVLPFPPQFYRRPRNRGMYGIFPSDKPPPLPYTPPHHPPRLSSRMPNSRQDNKVKDWKSQPRFRKQPLHQKRAA